MKRLKQIWKIIFQPTKFQEEIDQKVEQEVKQKADLIKQDFDKTVCKIEKNYKEKFELLSTRKEADDKAIVFGSQENFKKKELVNFAISSVPCHGSIEMLDQHIVERTDYMCDVIQNRFILDPNQSAKEIKQFISRYVADFLVENNFIKFEIHKDKLNQFGILQSYATASLNYLEKMY